MRLAPIIAAAAIVLATTGCSHRAPTVGLSPATPPSTDPTASPALNTSVATGIEIGQRAPDFTLTSFTGERVSLSSLRGRPIIIDFWAGWCPFCITEFPALERAYQSERAAGLVVLGVHRSADEDQAAGERFARDRGVTFPLLQDEGDRVYRTFSGGTPAMPLSYFIDRDGIIRAKVFGPKTDAQIEQHLTRIR